MYIYVYIYIYPIYIYIYVRLFRNLLTKSSVLTIMVLEKLKKISKIFDNEIDFTFKYLNQQKKIRRTFQIYFMAKDFMEKKKK